MEISSCQPPGSWRCAPRRLRLVDAHDVTGLGQDLDLTARDGLRALRCSGGAPGQAILSAEDDQGWRFDRPQLPARDADRLPNPCLALPHQPHPGAELVIHALALTQGTEDDAGRTLSPLAASRTRRKGSGPRAWRAMAVAPSARAGPSDAPAAVRRSPGSLRSTRPSILRRRPPV